MLPFNLNDKPLFLSDLQEYLKNQNGNTYDIIFKIKLPTGKIHIIKYIFPKDVLIKENPQLYKNYLIALTNNIIVTFGGVFLQIYFEINSDIQKKLFFSLENIFEIHSDFRKSYGCFINYADRINRHYSENNFKFKFSNIDEYTDNKSDDYFSVYDFEKKSLSNSKKIINLPENETWLALDIGGNSIKGVILHLGKIVAYLNKSWHPARMTEADEFNQGIIDAIENLTTQVKNDTEIKFDAAIIGYPDIIIDNKVIGGETYKHLGIRSKYKKSYNEQFIKLSNFDSIIKKILKPEAFLLILNDGNAAALIESIQNTVASNNQNNDFLSMVHTIGTEMGTGFFSPSLIIQGIPLECYQYIIDLGMNSSLEYDSTDIRSVKNTNSKIPGTVQKYVTQMGLFRLSIQGMLRNDIETFKILIDEDLIKYENGLLTVNLEPKDMRSKLTYRLIEMLNEGDESVSEAMLTMGKALATTIDQVSTILPEVVNERILSGGIVSDNLAYETIKKGILKTRPQYKIERLGDDNSCLPLLKNLDKKKKPYQIALGELYVLNALKPID